MTGRIVVGLAILTLSTSAASAAQQAYYYGHHYYGHPMRAYARVAPPPAPVGPGWMGGVKQSDYEMYLKNLRDSGYDPKNDYNNGIMRTN